MVAFSKDGLLPVAKKVREKFHPCPIVIAADNDRWTSVKQKEGLPDIPNPGVHYAREAAKAVKGCEVAIPDFHDLSNKPTDFDDLRAVRAMRRCGIGSTPSERIWLSPLVKRRQMGRVGHRRARRGPRPLTLHEGGTRRACLRCGPRRVDGAQLRRAG